MEYISVDQLKMDPISCHYFNSYGFREPAFAEKIIQMYEIDIITRGTANLTVDGFFHRYQKGEICFRKPGQLNQQDLDSPYECMYFYFNVIKKSTRESLPPSSYFTHFFLNLPTLLPAESCGEIRETVFRLYQHFFFHSEYDNLVSEAMLSLLTAQLYKISMKNQSQSLLKHHPAIRKSIDYIQSHLNCTLSIEDVATQCGLSPKYFQQVFKESTGKTPNHFIMEQKLNLAQERLLSTDLPISDIAFDCGFASSAYFTRVFKQFFHQTPREFRNKIV